MSKKIIQLLIIISIAILLISIFLLEKFEKIESSSLEDFKEIETVNTEAPAPIIEEKIKAPILIYHHIREINATDSPEDYQFIVSLKEFKKQMEYLKSEGYETIKISDLAFYFEGKAILPTKPVIITFDDGLKNQYQNAYPVLKDLKFTATFFIFANAISQNNRYMNWEELKEMAEQGIEIGSHGYYHLRLDKETVSNNEREIIESKKIIEEKLGKKIYSFSYPFGAYTASNTEMIKDAGYLSARDITYGSIHAKEDLFKLDAYFVTNDFSYFKNILKN